MDYVNNFLYKDPENEILFNVKHILYIYLVFMLLLLCQCNNRKENTKIGTHSSTDTIQKKFNNFLDFNYKFKYSEGEVIDTKGNSVKTDVIKVKLKPIISSDGVKEMNVEATNYLPRKIRYSYRDFYRKNDSKWEIIPTAIEDLGWLIDPNSTCSINWNMPYDDVFRPGNYKLLLEFKLYHEDNTPAYRINAYFDLVEK